MRGLNGELRYGAVDIARGYSLIGVVSGESPTAYAVPVARGMIQWTIGQECVNLLYPADSLYPPTQIVLERPNPAIALRSGRTEISFTAWTLDTGSGYPNAALWIDGRHVNGRLEPGPNRSRRIRLRWIGAARLRPGRHVMVAGVRGRITARAWVLTVRAP